MLGRRARHHILIIVGSGLFGLTGCPAGGAGTTCSPGDTASCQCADHSSSVRSCLDNGTYGACQCAASSDGGSSDGGSSDGGRRTCTGGLTDCGGTCVDLTSDPAHCASCGHPCAANEICSGGSCQAATDCTAAACTGFTWCDPGTHACLPGCDHDGQCTTGQICDPTTHACACPTGQSLCSGTCVDLAGDGANCGRCGHLCTGGTLCIDSTCQDPAAACTSYDVTGRLGSCDANTPCDSTSMQCLRVTQYPGAASGLACLDRTPCTSTPTAHCCGAGEFCGMSSEDAATDPAFCCVPGETVFPEGAFGATCVDAGAPIGCQTDSDCPAVWGRGHCNTALSPPRCVACFTAQDCASGQHCDVSSGSCVACVSSSDCAPGTVCDSATHACVQCVSDAECGGLHPVCDTASNTCVQCETDSQCGGATPHCAGANACVQCTTSSECSDPARPICDALFNGGSGNCVACLGGSTCQTFADGNQVCADGNSMPSPSLDICTTAADCSGPTQLCEQVPNATYKACYLPCQ